MTYFSNFDWRSGLIDVSEMSNALDGLNKRRREREEREANKQALLQAYNSLEQPSGPPPPGPAPIDVGTTAPVDSVGYGVPGAAKNALFDLGNLQRSTGPNAANPYGIPIHNALSGGGRDQSMALNPEFGNRLQRTLSNMPPELKDQLEINEAYRSPEYQGQLYNKYQNGTGGLAAPPGRSRHNSGSAVDFSPVGGYGSKYDRAKYNLALEWLYRNGESYGIENPQSIRSRDPHHFQMAGARPENVPQAERAVTNYAGSRPTRTADNSGRMPRAAFEALAGNAGTQEMAGKLVMDQYNRQNPTREDELNYQIKLTAQQRQQVEYFGKSATALMQGGGNPQMWSQLLNEYSKAFPDDQIDPEEADPVTGPKIMAMKAGMVLDPNAGRRRALEDRKLEAEIGKLEREALRPSGTGNRPPSGYRFAPDGNLEPIPGGPAEKLAAETAGKVGMMNEALRNLPTIRNVFLGKDGNPKVQGHQIPAGGNGRSVLGEAFDYYANRGDTGEGYRLGVGAIESVLRAASGAAVPEQEVKRYTSLFLPGPMDTNETRARKLDSLERWISSMNEAVQRGRPVDPAEAARISEGLAAGRANEPAAPVRVETPEQAMSLPPGTQFMTPDGRIKVRP